MTYISIPLSAHASDVSGQTYGRLTAIAPVGKDKHKGLFWLFICACGTEHVSRIGSVKSGDTKSCGCSHRDWVTSGQKTHGMTGTSIHGIWNGMRNRCINEHKNYGGRGIKVCDEWLNSFDAFYRDMGDRPSDKHSIDRIDNDGNYEPGNCRWATTKTQRRNTRRAIRLTYKGENLFLAEWAERFNLSYGIVYSRINIYGWSIEKALTTPKLR